MNDLLKMYGPLEDPNLQEQVQEEGSTGCDISPGPDSVAEQQEQSVKMNCLRGQAGLREPSTFSSGHCDRREEIIDGEMTGIFGAEEDTEADQGMRQTERGRWSFHRIRNALSCLFHRTGNLPELWWADLIFILLTIFGIFRIVTNLDQIIYCIFQLICGFLTIAIIGLLAVGIILILYFALRRRRW